MTTVTAPTTDLFGTPSPDAAAEAFAERVTACLPDGPARPSGTPGSGWSTRPPAATSP